MQLYRDIPLPERNTRDCLALIDWARERDPIGHRVHCGLAIATMALLPLSSSLGSIASTLLIGYAILRTPVLWRCWAICCRSWMLLPAILFFLWCAIALAWSEDPVSGARALKSQRYLLLIPALVPMARLARPLLFAMVGGLAFQNVVQIAEISGLTRSFEAGDDPRTGGLSHSPLPVGLWLIFGLGVLTDHSLFARKSHSLARGTLGALAAVGLIISGARSAFIGAALALPTGILVSMKTIRARSVLLWGAITLVLGGVLLAGLLAIDTPMTHYITSTVPNVKRALVDGDFKSSSGQRLLWWRIGLESSAKHPLIGIGLGDTKALLDADIRIQTRGGTFHRDDVHSSYISALVEMGAVGFLLYVAASGWLLVTCVRRARRGAVFGAALVSASVAWCVFNVFSTGYTSGQVFALYGVIAAFALMPITRNDLAE
jgi:O-antigen ligase